MIALYNTTKQLKGLFDQSIVPKLENKSARIFLDVRGMFINIHDAEGNRMLVEDFDRNGHLYSNKIINIINNWSNYFRSKNIDCKFVLFAETGDSVWHENLLENGYKIDRKTRRAKSIPEQERNKGSLYIKNELNNLAKTFNMLGTNVAVILSNQLEIDLAPHFIIKHVDINPDHYYNIIFTKDKDIAQTIDENTIIVRKKVRGDYELIDKENAYKMLKLDKEIDIQLFSIALSILGDAADSIPGIKGCGEKSVSKFLHEHGENILNIEQGGNIYEKVCLYCKDNMTQINKFLTKEKVVEDFGISFACIDFDHIIKHNYDYLIETIARKYMAICESESLHEFFKQEKERIFSMRMLNTCGITEEQQYFNLKKGIK